MPLDHEPPLSGFARTTGGSAGEGTHGGTDIKRPDGMPTKADCDVVTSTADQFASAVQRDNTSVYVDATIDMTDYVSENGGIDMGSNVTLVGGFCDPSIPGRGPEIVCDTNGHRLLTSCYGTAPTLWGMSFRGPRLDYHDPDHTADDFDSKQSTALFCYDDNGTFRVIGSEFRGWTMAGVEVGAKTHKTEAEIRRCSMHKNQMEHLGYSIQHYNGFMSVTDSFFDRCRHAISSFGYPTGGYAVATSVFGPGPWAGHQIDIHGLANNINTDSDVAGQFVRVYRCTVMGTEDVRGYGQEGLAIRGVPANKEPGSYVDKTHFYHPNEPSPTGEQGDAYRQETSEWDNFEPRDNHFGESVADGYGAPRATDERPAEDDEDTDTEDPSGTPTAPDQSMKLTIHGKGSSGRYEIWLDGSAEATGNIEGNDSIEQSDGLTKVSGGIVGAADTYDLSDGATLERAWFKAPVRVTLDGEPIDTGPLVAAEAQRRFDEQSQRLDELREWIKGVGESLRSFGGNQ